VVGISYLLSFLAIYGYRYSDTILLVLLVTASAMVYYSLHWLTANGLKATLNIGSDQLLISPDRYRLFVSLTGYLTIGIKYLLLLILLLPLFLTHDDIFGIGLMALGLLVLAVYVLVKRQLWGDQLLQIYIGTASCILLFATENYGRDNELFGIPLLIISNCLFLLLLMCEAGKIFLRNRSSKLLVSPLEYLLVFIVLCMPLLPAHFTGQFHVLTVAAKSAIMFVGFKLVLMRQIKRNRKIIVAITLSLLIIGIRYLVSVLS
jgi:general stress protein CsbA